MALYWNSWSVNKTAVACSGAVGYHPSCFLDSNPLRKIIKEKRGGWVPSSSSSIFQTNFLNVPTLQSACLLMLLSTYILYISLDLRTNVSKHDFGFRSISFAYREAARLNFIWYRTRHIDIVIVEICQLSSKTNNPSQSRIAAKFWHGKCEDTLQK